MLEQEREIYQEHLPEWLHTQSGKFVLIKGQEVIGFYNTNDEALTEATRRFGLASYLVRRILPAQEEVKVPALTLGLLKG